MDVDVDADPRSGTDGDATPSSADVETTPPSSLTRRAVLAGSASALAAGAAGTVAAQQGGSGEPVQVDLVNYAFEPGTDSTLVVPPGTTVEFVWQTNNHNIHVDRKPAESDWAGVEKLHNSGHTHTHTFTATGDYHFWCVPHKSLGMVGDIRVEEGASIGTVVPAEPFTFPGGDSGLSFVGLVLGTAGSAAALVLAGELKRGVTRDAEGPTSAHTTALVAVGIGLVLVLAVVARLIVG